MKAILLEDPSIKIVGEALDGNEVLRILEKKHGGCGCFRYPHA